MQVEAVVPNWWLFIGWMVLFFLYLFYMKRTLSGFFENLIAGNYNEQIWDMILKMFTEKHEKGGRVLNKRGLAVLEMLIAYIQAYFSRAAQGKKGQVMRDGGVMAAMDRGENPIDLIAGKKNAGLIQTLLDAAPLLERLGILK